MIPSEREVRRKLGDGEANNLRAFGLAYGQYTEKQAAYEPICLFGVCLRCHQKWQLDTIIHKPDERFRGAIMHSRQEMFFNGVCEHLKHYIQTGRPKKEQAE